MVRRGELTDKSWEWIAPLLPENGRRGGWWRDHRPVVNGILWKLRTGVPWRDLPSCYAPWQTCYDRFVRWRRDGTWKRRLPTCRASRTRRARLCGRSASTAQWRGHTSTRRGRAADRAWKTKKGDRTV